MGDVKPTELIDNDRVRVTEWCFGPGDATGQHRHEIDFVVVPVTAGKMLFKEAGGDWVAPIELGKPQFREKGTEHDVINLSESDEVVFIEVELK